MRKIPFKAALFDLDGTLLDSLDVWKRVDEQFFRARGMSVPKGFGRAIAGLSYRESAEYTVAHYLPEERWERIVEEWMEMARREYAENVPFKPGARSYLMRLKRAGVRMAVTTAMPRKLFVPCLERLGALEWFDALCSTEDTEGRGKASGEVFLLAAKQLGVEPEECAVFEDVIEGIRGAKKAGMQVWCVKDAHSQGDFAEMEQMADGMLDSMQDMCRVHDFEPSPRCVIFTAHCEGDPRVAYAAEEDDYVLCADGGWKIAEKCGAKPALVIGDFDSSDAPQAEAVERHPVMKDDTDTMLCLRRGLRMGYERFLIVGGFGGRLDHTMANLQTLIFAAHFGAQAQMCDGRRWATVIENGSIRIRRRPGKLSMFAMSERCRGITSTGTVYNLTDGELDNFFPLGVSNEFAADEASVCVREGALLIIADDD